MSEASLKARGLAHYNRAEYSRALGCFRKALAAGDDPELRCFAGHALRSLGRRGQALAEFLGAAEAFPGHAPAWSGLGALFLEAGRPESAEAAARRALRLDPKDAAARGALCAVRARAARGEEGRGRRAEAKRLWRKVLALEPGHAEARAALAPVARRREPAEELGRRMREAARRWRWSAAEKALAALRRAGAPAEEASALLSAALKRRALVLRGAGRWAEALACLRRLARLDAGAAAPELSAYWLARGRAFAARGLWARAESCAGQGGGDSARAEILLSRAQKERAGGRLSAAEAALRRAIALDPTAEHARRELRALLSSAAESAQSRGEWAESERILRRLLEVSPSELPAVLAMCDLMRLRGDRLKPAHFEAALGAAGGAGLDDHLRFLLLLKLGRWEEAFALGESILDRGPTAREVSGFLDTWHSGPRDLRAHGPAEARALSRLARARPASPWPRFYLGLLKVKLGQDGLADMSSTESSPVARYGWMHAKTGWALASLGRFEEAQARIEGALSFRPLGWKGRAFLAEALLCRGRQEEAFAEMERARAAAPPEDKPAVLAWRGEFDLWLGAYEPAVERLDAACAAGARYAHGWRGAAKLLLGRPKEALADIDLALKIFPQDEEALVWRGEALRALRRPAEALAVLDRAPLGVWTLVNRGLARAALGDVRGLRRDHAALPAFVRRYIEERIGPGRPPEAVLEAALRLAKGFRREEFRQAVWLAVPIVNA